MNAEQRQLIDRQLDDDLDAGGAAELDRLLAHDAAAVAYLAQRAELVADLRRSLQGRALQQRVMAKVVPVPRWRFASVTWAAAAAVVLLGALAWLLARPDVQLLRGVGPQFAGAARTSGEWVGRDFDLTAGLLELRFRRADATVVIEAPATFRVEDAKTLRVESGRVTAHVRDGRQGLRVLTPHTDVLDLGTRFAVDVIAGQRSEVHVFEGKVEASGVGGEKSAPHPMRASEALRFAPASSPETRLLRSGAFVQPEEIDPLAAALRSGRQQRALESARALQGDAALIAFLDFQQGADTAHLSTGEAVRGTRWVQGRFPGRQALEFVEADDHVRVNFPQRSRQVTLMTWVRLDRLPDGASALFHTDDWQTPGQLHWTMHDRGGMLFSMFGQEFPVAPDRPRTWPRSVLPLAHDLGGWVHLALVYDAAARAVRFYSNGRPDGGRTVLHDLPAVLGPAQIGNWNVKDWQDRNPLFNRHDRRLSGRMDEFVVLGRALSTEEIATYFAATNPYQ